MISIALSIIIPAFNVEGYIAKCLDSLIIAGFQNYEIIVVNDGSTDGTQCIIDEYVERYDFIKVLYQTNLGVSSARNKGLEQAIGTYIWFFDSDDYLNNSTKDILGFLKYLEAGSADIIFIQVEKSTNISKVRIEKGLEALEIEGLRLNFYQLVNQNFFTSYAVDKIVRKDLLLSNHIEFIPQVSMSEDMLWCLNVFMNAISYVISHDMTYIYRQNRIGAATATLDNKKLSDMLYVLHKSMQLVESNTTLDHRFKGGLQLYISRLWFNLVPELIVYNKALYNDNRADLSNYLKKFQLYELELIKVNRGALMLGHLIRLFGWNVGLIVYAKTISIRRSPSINTLINYMGYS